MFLFFGTVSNALRCCSSHAIAVFSWWKGPKKRRKSISHFPRDDQHPLEFIAACFLQLHLLLAEHRAARGVPASLVLDFNVQIFHTPPPPPPSHERRRTRGPWTSASSSHPAGAEFKSMWPQGELSISPPSALPHRAAVGLLRRVKIRPELELPLSSPGEGHTEGETIRWCKALTWKTSTKKSFINVCFFLD